MGKEPNRLVKFVLLFGAIIVGVAAISRYYMAQEKTNSLYRHGFQLLEEQIAIYIVEHYSGVSKVEFSPIFMSGGGSQSFLNLDVVTAIYDNHGNKALLSGKIGEIDYGPDGLSGGIEVLDFDYEDKEIIYLSQSAKGGEIDVSGYKQLPKEAKLSEDKGTDEIISLLIKEGKIKGVEKSDKGSAKAEISYNLEIKKGSWREWR